MEKLNLRFYFDFLILMNWVWFNESWFDLIWFLLFSWIFLLKIFSYFFLLFLQDPCGLQRLHCLADLPAGREEGKRRGSARKVQGLNMSSFHKKTNNDFEFFRFIFLLLTSSSSSSSFSFEQGLDAQTCSQICLSLMKESDEVKLEISSHLLDESTKVRSSHPPFCVVISSCWTLPSVFVLLFVYKGEVLVCIHLLEGDSVARSEEDTPLCDRIRAHPSLGLSLPDREPHWKDWRWRPCKNSLAKLRSLHFNTFLFACFFQKEILETCLLDLNTLHLRNLEFRPNEAITSLATASIYHPVRFQFNSAFIS